MSDLDRNLRSGRHYDPLIVPPGPRNRRRKASKGKKKEKANEKASKTDEPLVLGTTAEPQNLAVDASPTHSGVRTRRGLAPGGPWQGTRMAPRLYRQVHGRLPPIRAPKRSIESAPGGGFCQNLGASVDKEDAASTGEPIALSASLVAPPEAMRGDSDILDPSDEEDNISVTTRTSRSHGDESLNAMSTGTPIAQYGVQSDIELANRFRRARKMEKRPRAKSMSDGTPSPKSSFQSNYILAWAKKAGQACEESESGCSLAYKGEGEDR